MIKYICLARFEEALKVKRDSQGIGTERDESTPIHSFYTNEEIEAQESELIYPHN